VNKFLAWLTPGRIASIVTLIGVGAGYLGGYITGPVALGIASAAFGGIGHTMGTPTK
jgi:hypothetical protein